MLAGCARSTDPSAVSAPPAVPGAQLTDAEIETFLSIVPMLPGQAPPAFRPAAELDLTTDQRAADMVARWQREFRSSYSPQVQARLWKRDSHLRSAILETGLEPEQLAALLVQLSSAVVRESVDPGLDLAELGRSAERSIESLCQQFDGLERDPRLSPSLRNARAEFLTMMLKEMVAYREFLSLLETVPSESVAAVARRRDVLRSLLPASETVQAFEKRLAAQTAIQQVSHEERTPGPRAAK